MTYAPSLQINSQSNQQHAPTHLNFARGLPPHLPLYLQMRNTTTRPNAIQPVDHDRDSVVNCEYKLPIILPNAQPPCSFLSIFVCLLAFALGFLCWWVCTEKSAGFPTSQLRHMNHPHLALHCTKKRALAGTYCRVQSR